MENQLLFSKPGRQRWTNKAPPLERVVAISRDVWKTQQHESSFQAATYLTFIKMVDSAIGGVLSTLMGNPVYDFCQYWGLILLYNPVDFATAVVINVYTLMINLPPFFTMVVLPVLLVYFVYHTVQRALLEYQTFLDLGRGGTPSTPMGLVKVSVKKYFAGVSVLDPPHVDPMLEPYRGMLFTLEKRLGERPVVKGVAPQRQFDQKTPVSTFNKLLQMLKDAAAKDDSLRVTTSYLEGHTDALKANFPHRAKRVLDTDGEWDYEIAHPHRHDGSMHIILHPEDIKTVIERGWGERHPLATNAWWWKFFYHHIRGKRRPVPYNLILVYAPRSSVEYEAVQEIINAAIWFHKEKDICDKISQGKVARADCGKIVAREEALNSGLWVESPEGRLITLEKALDRGLYQGRLCEMGPGRAV